VLKHIPSRLVGKGFMKYIKKYGIIGTAKRIRVRKKEKNKKEKISRERYQRSKIQFRPINESYIIESSKNTGPSQSSDGYRFEGMSIKEEKKVKTVDIKKEVEIEEEKEKINPNMLIFEHQITDFEVKLRYLNLKDTSGKEFGRFFPPIRSKLIIMDEEGREFAVIRAGNNQISGDIVRFLKTNELKPGDIVSVEYDRDETSDQGNHIIHFKIKK
jgi:hypothetical protein